MATVLILGGTGFIGRNLCEYLVKSGVVSHVRCVDKVFPQTAFLNAEHTALFANPIVQFVQGNLSNAASIAKCFARDDGKGLTMSSTAPLRPSTVRMSPSIRRRLMTCA